MSIESKISAFDQACGALNLYTDQAMFFNDLVPSDYDLLTDIYEAANGFWNGNDFGKMKLLKIKLAEIKKNPKALDRVKAVYELVTEQQGEYDPEALEAQKQNIRYPDFHFIYSPERTLQTGGVCRDFSMLLKWALMQVARSSSISRDAEVFTADIRAGNLVTGLGHMWVTVNLPEYDFCGRLVAYHSVDLDPTNFKKGFVPLMPYARRLSDSELLKRFNQCEAIKSCLKTSGHHSK